MNDRLFVPVMSIVEGITGRGVTFARFVKPGVKNMLLCFSATLYLIALYDELFNLIWEALSLLMQQGYLSLGYFLLLS